MKHLLLLTVALLSLSAQALEPRFEPMLLDLLRQQYSLNKSDASPNLVSAQSVLGDNGRETLAVTLADGKAGRFRLLMEGPAGFQATRDTYPVLFISAGFFSGTQPVKLFKDAGNFIVAAFEYTPDPAALLRQPDALSRTVSQVPARLYLTLKWMTRQTWANPSRLHILGVSLGSLYLPSAVRLLQTDGFQFASYNTAFGGGDVRTPFYNLIRTTMGANEARIAADFVSSATAPLDPAIYLPQIKGMKLVIHGSKDTVFTADTRARLNASLKGPKLTCTIDGGHIDVDKPSEIRMTLAILRPWLMALETGRGVPRIDEPGTLCSAEF